MKIKRGLEQPFLLTILTQRFSTGVIKHPITRGVGYEQPHYPEETNAVNKMNNGSQVPRAALAKLFVFALYGRKGMVRVQYYHKSHHSQAFPSAGLRARQNKQVVRSDRNTKGIRMTEVTRERRKCLCTDTGSNNLALPPAPIPPPALSHETLRLACTHRSRHPKLTRSQEKKNRSLPQPNGPLSKNPMMNASVMSYRLPDLSHHLCVHYAGSSLDQVHALAQPRHD